MSIYQNELISRDYIIAYIPSIKKMLGNQEHPIAVKLTTTRRTMSAFKFDIPTPKTEAYKNSFIQQHLKTIRDEAKPRNKEEKINAAANKIKTTSTIKAEVIVIQKPNEPCPKCGRQFEAIHGVKVHLLRSCKATPPDSNKPTDNNTVETKTV